MIPEHDEDRSEEIARQVDAMYAVAASTKQGDIVTHESLAKASGEEYGSNRYYSVVKKVMARLREEKGLVMHAVYTQGVGYHVLTDAEQFGEAKRHTIKSRKSLRRGLKATECMPPSRLKFNDQIRRVQMINAQKSAIREAGMKIRLLDSIQKKPASMPVPKSARKHREKQVAVATA